MEYERPVRKTLLVNRPIQKRLMRSIVLVPFLLIILSASLLGLLCWTLPQAMGPSWEPTDDIDLMLGSVTLLLVLAVFVAAHGLVFSHRIAGPMYRISKTLEQVRREGFQTRCHLREADLLKTLGDDLNDFLDWLEEEHDANSETSEEQPADEAGVS